jgi:mannose-6-phosphate isomerase-like protein (cupin superfamily)
MEMVKKYSPDSEFFIEEGCFITELHNSDRDAGCSIARARVAPGMTTKLHCLRDIIERYVILAGTGEAEVGDKGAVAVEAMDVVLVPAGVPQRISNKGATDLVFLCICTPRFVTDNYLDLDN